MNELTRALTADSAHAAPAHILEGIEDGLAHLQTAGAPHSIYQELWHITFWQQVTLDWVQGRETPAPLHNDLSFPTPEQASAETWTALCQRFFAGNAQAGLHAGAADSLEREIRCPSPPGLPVRTMTVRDQLISLAAHNAYHFGRIVLLRQLGGAWPPASGGFTW